MCVLICVFTYVCHPYVCSHMCVLICVFSYVCPHMCVLICMFTYVCHPYVCSHMCVLICVFHNSMMHPHENPHMSCPHMGCPHMSCPHMSCPHMGKLSEHTYVCSHMCVTRLTDASAREPTHELPTYELPTCGLPTYDLPTCELPTYELPTYGQVVRTHICVFSYVCCTTRSFSASAPTLPNGTSGGIKTITCVKCLI